RPDGFELTFTHPVNRATAEKPESYGVSGFVYYYHRAYGSAPMNRMACPVRKVVVAPDGLSVRLGNVCLREGYVHEVKAAGLRAAGSGEPLLHATAYYTLNRVPDGDRIIPPEPREAELCLAPIPTTALANTRKHPTKAPGDWTDSDGDKTILLGTLPGLKFDTALISAKAGSRLRLVFRNSDDMLHNFVLCAPGRGEAVGLAALALGIDGLAKNYVPESDDVLYHSALTLPEGSDTIFFNAPTQPGDYDFICSFPGHAMTMKGILRVER
ncbi:MAG TPA: plastocyanin/azurin family copper-binding protein, partial [Opitutaceae bacterium]|nr:plastocyanin/azurin family copper-binding protein [Opitutaceae bacterium]